MAKRLIDANDLMNRLYDYEFAMLCPLDEVDDVIDCCPTVDAVEVVRCRDCKCFSRDKEYNRAWCNYSTGSTETAVNGFCFRGARKDGGADNGEEKKPLNRHFPAATASMSGLALCRAAAM